VRTGRLTKWVRQGEGDQKIGDGQKQIGLFLQPLGGLLILALGAVAVLAGVVAVVVLSTVLAPIEMAAQSLGSTVFNVSHGAPVTGQQAMVEGSSIVWPVAAEDVRQLEHERSPRWGWRSSMMRLIASEASSLARVVRWV
jgi:hypothetical protein